jgi:folate-binding protein YgfZ
LKAVARNEPGSSAEHHALQDSAGLLDESTRTILSISGDRAADMLHGLVTNDVKRLSVGQGLYAFMLTPKGRPVAEMRLLRLDAAFWMDVPASCRESALAHLRKYLPPIFAQFDETDTCRLAVVGPLAAAAIDGWAGASVTEGIDPLESRPLDVEGKELVLARREVIEGPGFDLYVSAEDREDVRSGLLDSVLELGGREVGPEAWEVLRVERGIPVFGRDFSEENLAQETAQDARAISFDKGCYTGQEVVARIHFRGHVNRILRGCRLDDPSADPSADPSGRPSLAAGRPLFDGDRERGLITSPVDSPRFGRIALGLVRTEIEPRRRLALESSGEEVVEIMELPFDPVIGSDPA